MKRSKIFLGITTGILAVAGVTAAKHYGTSVTRFYLTNGGNYCLSRSETCIKQGTVACDYITTGGTHFTQFTQGPVGPTNGSNCTQQLFWDGTHK